MTPEQAAVLTDYMRSIGVDERIIKWVEHPESVDLLLQDNTGLDESGECCKHCRRSWNLTHDPACIVRLAALSISVNPEETVRQERNLAHREALFEQNRRNGIDQWWIIDTDENESS